MARYSEATPPGPSVHRPDKPGHWDGGDDELDVFAAERYFNGDDAPWCARSASSLSSAFRTGTTHEHDRSVVAATSSSEVSRNSRSALLPDGKVVAAPSVVGAEPPDGMGSKPPRGRGKPPPPTASHLRRWMLGVAGCACLRGDGEEFSGDEVEDAGVGGKNVTNGVRELFQGTESNKELSFVESTSVRVRPGGSLDQGDAFLAGNAAFSPVHVNLVGDARRRAANSDEISTPILNPAITAAALLHGQRRKSCAMLRPRQDFERGALVSTRKQDSALTIIAGGGGGLHTAHGGLGMSPCDTSEDDAATSEVGCAYPPSEASVVWSVVTAEGVASCNFSSAASGCYYHFNGDEDRQAVGRGSRRRRNGVINAGGLLTCMGDKAVNAIGPVWWPEVEPASMTMPIARNDRWNRGLAEYPDLMRRQ